jgi:hypothetical protein
MGTSEIESSPILQAFYYVLLFKFVLSFQDWVLKDTLSPELARQGKHICPSWFQNCESWYVFEAFPRGWGLPLLYAILTGFLFLGAFFAWKKRWWEAQLVLLPPLLWKILMPLALTYNVIVEYEYFSTPFVLLFLFGGRKIYFLRRLVVLLYLLAAFMKFNDSWIVGTYFSSLKWGIPLVPREGIPLVTNLIAGWEIFGTFLLLSTNRRWRWAALAFWAFFHLYSILFVGYLYPMHCLPMLLVLFLPDFQEETPDLRPESRFGWGLFALILFIFVLPYKVPGEVEYSLQRLKISLEMFDANHQCASTEIVHEKDGRVSERHQESRAAQSRCPPYAFWYKIKQECERRADQISSIEWKFDSSVNGGPFYRIVDVKNACELEFQPLQRNEWMKFPSEGAPVVGYPRRNHPNNPDPDQGKPLVYPDEEAERLTPLQIFLTANLPIFVWLWRILWGATIAFFAARAVLRAQKRKNAIM